MLDFGYLWYWIADLLHDPGRAIGGLIGLLIFLFLAFGIQSPAPRVEEPVRRRRR